MKCFSAILLLSVSGVISKGLREEFTWSRISYDLRGARGSGSGSGNANRGPRYGYGGSRPGQNTFPSNVGTDGGSQVSSDYIYQNNVPMGANRWRNKLFVTVPRRRPGVPSTLNFVWINGTQKHNAPLIPYPNYEINQLPSSSDRNQGGSGGVNLVSVYRTFVDNCDRLWIPDNGLIETPGNNSRVQPPSVVIIDLHTNRVLRKHVLPSGVYRPETTLASITVDEGSDCHDAYAYFPDLSGYGLIVYSLRDDNSWRVTHNYFFVEPLAGEFRIGGFDFQWNDGIFSTALSDRKPDGSRTVYFHSMAGTHIYSVSNTILKNRNLATRSYHGHDFKVELDRGVLSQTSSSDLHKRSGVKFLGLVNQNAVGCWNTNKGPRIENFDTVQKDDRKMIYPCDIKVYQDELIVLTNNMPIFLYGQLDYDQVNFRVWLANINEAIKDTDCSERNAHGHSY